MGKAGRSSVSVPKTHHAMRDKLGKCPVARAQGWEFVCGELYLGSSAPCPLSPLPASCRSKREWVWEGRGCGRVAARLLWESGSHMNPADTLSLPKLAVPQREPCMGVLAPQGGWAGQQGFLGTSFRVSVPSRLPKLSLSNVSLLFISFWMGCLCCKWGDGEGSPTQEWRHENPGR